MATCDKYPYACATFRFHLLQCERNHWRKGQEKGKKLVHVKGTKMESTKDDFVKLNYFAPK